MKSENKNLKQDYYSELKSLSILSFTIYFCFFCSFFSAVCLSTPQDSPDISSAELDPVNLLFSYLSPNSEKINKPHTPIQAAKLQLDRHQKPVSGNVAINFAAEIGDTLPQNDLYFSKDSVADLERQLWQARIGFFKDKKAEQSESKKKLQQIIENIRTIEFKPQKKAPKPMITIEPIQKTSTDKKKTLSDTPIAQKHSSKKDKGEPLGESLSDHTLELVEDFSKHPEKLKNPLQLGEILYHSGYLKHAAICYQIALDRVILAGEDPNRDKPWILFQLGNCLWNDDPVEALEKYSQLIAEYPHSPWADLAESKSKLIDWYLKDKPKALIIECRS